MSDLIKQSYVPGANFLAWMRKHRPEAVQHFSEKQAYPMYVCPRSGRHRVDVPGTHRGVPGAIHFDRKVGTDELCMLFDLHPDLLQP